MTNKNIEAERLWQKMVKFNKNNSIHNFILKTIVNSPIMDDIKILK
jgi:hypothetical protein